jgi:hypothetical protein
VQTLGREIVVKPALLHDRLTATRTRPALHSLYNIGGTDHPSCGHEDKGISEVGHPEEEI